MKNKIKNKGFTLLLSVLVTSIILSIGMGIFSIMTKELKLSGMGRESQIAFYAADAGIECFFYWEIKHPNLSDTAFNAPNTINCAGNSVANNFSGNASNFTVPLSNNSCAKIKVAKRGLVTTVESRGYNTACDSTSPFKVERAIQLVSTKQEGGGDYTKPDTPVLTARPNSFNMNSLTWNDSSGAYEYEIYKSTDNISFTFIGLTSDLLYVDNNLNSNTTYYYKIIASNDSDKSSYSNMASAKTYTLSEVINFEDFEDNSFLPWVSWVNTKGKTPIISDGIGISGTKGLLLDSAMCDSLIDDSIDYNFIIPASGTVNFWAKSNGGTCNPPVVWLSGENEGLLWSKGGQFGWEYFSFSFANETKIKIGSTYSRVYLDNIIIIK